MELFNTLLYIVKTVNSKYQALSRMTGVHMIPVSHFFNGSFNVKTQSATIIPTLIYSDVWSHSWIFSLSFLIKQNKFSWEGRYFLSKVFFQSFLIVSLCKIKGPMGKGKFSPWGNHLNNFDRSSPEDTTHQISKL